MEFKIMPISGLDQFGVFSTGLRQYFTHSVHIK